MADPELGSPGWDAIPGLLHVPAADFLIKSKRNNSKSMVWVSLARQRGERFCQSGTGSFIGAEYLKCGYL